MINMLPASNHALLSQATIDRFKGAASTRAQQCRRPADACVRRGHVTVCHHRARLVTGLVLAKAKSLRIHAELGHIDLRHPDLSV
jgi:hypothetical protein